MRYIRIHKEGRLILGSLLLILLLMNLFIYIKFQLVVLAINIVVSALLLFFFAYFFRNPVRRVVIDDPSLVVAPADGTIVVVEPVEENEYFGDKRIQVSIFMSVFLSSLVRYGLLRSKSSPSPVSNSTVRPAISNFSKAHLPIFSLPVDCNIFLLFCIVRFYREYKTRAELTFYAGSAYLFSYCALPCSPSQEYTSGIFTVALNRSPSIESSSFPP